MQSKNPKILIGIIVGTKQPKTLKVQVEGLKYNKLKSVKRTKNYYAHVESDEYSYTCGLRVAIKESKPISKTKRWTIEQVLG